jgi:hypothetical protein
MFDSANCPPGKATATGRASLRSDRGICALPSRTALRSAPRTSRPRSLRPRRRPARENRRRQQACHATPDTRLWLTWIVHRQC